MTPIAITVNGDARQFAACSLAEFIEAEGWAGRRIAVERNGDIVPKSRHAEIMLQTGDTLEIVVAVGGG